MLKIKVKASQITNLTDARYFAAKEVEWLSFNFTEGSDNYIDPMRARAMFEWVEGPRIVGEFDGLSAAEINFYTEGYKLSHIQVGVNTPNEDVLALKADSVIKEIVVDKTMTADILRGGMRPIMNAVEAFQLDFQKNGLDIEYLQNIGSSIKMNDLKELCKEFNIILAIDFPISSLECVLDLNPYALCLFGGDEEKVGLKSYDEIDEIFDKIEEE